MVHQEFYSAYQFLKHFLKAKNAHGLHSPFVFDLYTKAISAKKHYYAFDEIEDRRKSLSNSKQTIEVTDFGASGKGKSHHRKVSAIADKALAPASTGQMLFRLVDYLKPKTIIELGTSLGVNSLYLGSASDKAKVYTFEGCPNTAKIAQEGFDLLRRTNIELTVGNIDDTLTKKLKAIGAIDLAWMDANHRYEPTLRYFNQCLEHAHAESVFVLDDLYWSKGMEQAWKEIKQHPKVTLSLDFFSFGMVFLREKQPKQHFTLRW